MGQQQSAFVVEIAPRARFRPLPQAENVSAIDDNDEEEEEKERRPGWRITVNPTDGFSSSELLADVRRCVHRLSSARGHLLSRSDCRLLSTAISVPDCNELRLRALNVISQATAFPGNQQMMHADGIVQRIVDQLRNERRGAARVLLLQCVANLAVSGAGMVQDCLSWIIPLIDSKQDMERSVAIHALTNLSMSISSAQVPVYAAAVPLCLKRLWRRGEIDADVLRLLVNLACCPDLVPHILANKNVTGIFTLLESGNTEVTLRAITWFLCMTTAVDALSIGYDQIGTLNQDPFGNSQYTLFHGLYGMPGRQELQLRVQALAENDNTEIAGKSRRLVELLQAIAPGKSCPTLDHL